MTILTPYLLFDGNCLAAMKFYLACLGGNLTVTKVKDSPMAASMPEYQQEKVLNARLTGGRVEVSSSDWLRPDRMRIPGNAVCLYLSQGTAEEVKTLFGKLSDGADITDPLKQMPFGIYGALNDKFGMRWMFHAHG